MINQNKNRFQKTAISALKKMTHFYRYDRYVLFVILSAAKESECAKTLRESYFLVEIQILSLRSE
jgi:hypothetical protein